MYSCLLVYPQSIMGAVTSGKDMYLPKNISEIAALNYQPKHIADRSVIIAPRPMKTLQSHSKFAHQWQIQWEIDHGSRWSNPLTGWTSTNDPMNAVTVSCF
jgi:hypothetical protein